MEWVIAALAVGCLFFAFQVIMDYVRYKGTVAPRIRMLEEAKEELKEKIEEARTDLDDKQGRLDPLKGEIDRLEREYLDLQGQIEEERAKQKNRSQLPGRGAIRIRPRS